MDKTAQEAEAITLILASMEEGTSLRQSCIEHGVKRGTFLGWVDSDPELADHYARARARMLDVHAEELEDIGDQAANAETAVEVAGLKLKSDNRKWLLSKLASKKYGEKLELAGELNVKRSAADMTDDDLALIARSKLPPNKQADE